MPEINDIPPVKTEEFVPKEVDLDSPEMTPDEIANSPFAKMFKGGATKEDLRHFINNCLTPIIHECKRAEMVAKRSSRRFMDSITGKRSD
jgi:hypothetical protein